MENSICKNCTNAFTGNYCNQCGQKKFSEADKSFAHIGEELFHFITHFEGSFIRTLLTVLRHPGQLSLDYSNGIQKKYYKPISFFLLLVVIYLFFPLFAGLNMKLENYKDLDLFGGPIALQIQNKIASTGLSANELSELFHHKAEKIAKLLLFVLIPLTAIPLSLMNYRKRIKMYDHFIAATEINIFIVLVLFLIAPVFIILILAVLRLRDIGEDTLVPIFYGLSLFWLLFFFRKRYGEKYITAFLKSNLLLLIYWMIAMELYKTLLFEITIALL